MRKNQTASSFLGETFQVHVTPCRGYSGEDCRTLRFFSVFRVVSYSKAVTIYGSTHVETEFAVEGLVDDRVGWFCEEIGKKDWLELILRRSYLFAFID